MPLRLWFAIGAMVAAVGFLTWSHTHAYRAGKSAEREAALARSIEILRERNRVDDEVSNLDDAGLCAALGGRMLDGACQ